jgi:uncharacterized protein YodC (DUF2158 family)
MSDPKIVALNANPAKPEPKGKFSTGDVVQLNSGGACMTVRKASKSAVLADWINDSGELCTADFLPAMLREGEIKSEETPDDAAEEA